MKIEKNKIVFGAVLALIIIFIVAYSVLVLGDDKSENENLKETLVPELEEQEEDYTSKLDAINALKEVRETNAPSIYDEKLMDSLGFYDPNFLDKEKERIVDSIYRNGRIDYTENTYRNVAPKNRKEAVEIKIDSAALEKDSSISVKELSLEHLHFFASDPVKNEKLNALHTEASIYVTVDGNQKVKKDYRLRMRLMRDALINNILVPKNTPIYGFISFKPNRAMIEIENINHQSVKLKAYDFQDGSEGIYIENSFRAEAYNEVLGDIVEDINITGVPQVSGIKKVFQRSNRSVKVTVVNNYKLILKISNRR